MKIKPQNNDGGLSVDLAANNPLDRIESANAAFDAAVARRMQWYLEDNIGTLAMIEHLFLFEELLPALCMIFREAKPGDPAHDLALEVAERMQIRHCRGDE